MELKLLFLIVDILLFISWSYYFFVWEKKKLTVGVGIGIAVNWIVLICMYIFVRTPTDGDNGTKVGHESYHDSKKQLAEHKHLEKTATKVLGDNGTPVYIFDNFMTPDECAKIIKGAQGNMTLSTLTRASEDPTIVTVRRATLMVHPSKHMSIKKYAMPWVLITTCRNLVKYSTTNSGINSRSITTFSIGGEEFEEFAGDASSYQGQRTWTFMVFLNNVKKGGETEFISLNNLHVTPKKGTAVVWNSLNGDGTTNDRTLHQGKPILGGEKYIITKWFRERVQK